MTNHTSLMTSLVKLKTSKHGSIGSHSILEEPLIHIEHLDKKWCCYEWRRWWSWNKESTHEEIKISIELSFHDIVLLCICLYSVDLLCSILPICMWWVSSSWCYKTLHCYLSRMKPHCWHIGLVHNLNDVMVEMEGI